MHGCVQEHSLTHLTCSAKKEAKFVDVVYANCISFVGIVCPVKRCASPSIDNCTTDVSQIGTVESPKDKRSLNLPDSISVFDLRCVSVVSP